MNNGVNKNPGKLACCSFCGKSQSDVIVIAVRRAVHARHP
jgi:hypothetical protein